MTKREMLGLIEEARVQGKVDLKATNDSMVRAGLDALDTLSGMVRDNWPLKEEDSTLT